jgi:tetratricopeptide (TPR) repeat protein
MRGVAFGVAALALIVGAIRSLEAAEVEQTLVGTHVVTTAAEVQFVDRDGRPLGVARGGTVLDVLDDEGDVLKVDRGWIKRGDVVPQEDAIEFFNRQIGNQPTAVAYASRARVWNYRAEFDKAIDDCDEALRIDPECAMAFDRRAQALTAKGRVDEALADFENAISLTPNYASAYSHRARAWLEKGNFEKALADCHAALDRDPSIYLAHYYRGRVWSRKGATDKAVESYGRALELNPHFVPALNARGNEWFGKEQFAKAEADYSAAIRLDPKFDIVHVHYNRGNARLRLQKTELAKADYEEALSYDDKYVPAMQGLAACYAVELDYKTAIEWQEQAVKLAKAEQKSKMKAVLAHYRAARNK